MKKFYVLSLLLAITCNMFADNLSVADIQLAAGEEKSVTVSLANPDHSYVAFQFDLVLPEGVAIATDADEQYKVSLSARKRDHVDPAVGVIGANTYRILTYSNRNQTFRDVDGELVNIVLRASTTLAYGDYVSTITNAKFTEADGTKHTMPEVHFTISNPEPAPLVTVTVTDASRLYGDANPVFEYSVEGGTLDGKPELTCMATPTSTVGAYEIVATRGTITNENVNFVNGTLTVTKAPLTIKADDKQMTEGDPLPEFTATYEGFKNGETEDVLTAIPNFACHATPNSEPGEYDIVPSGAEATNYEISYVNGTLAIKEKKIVIVHVTDASRLYGDANPAFEYSVEGGTLDGKPELTCVATPTSTVGAYEIVATRGNITNENVNFVNGTLTVKKAPLTIKADDKQMTEGDPLPEFTATYEGFKNGETEEVLTAVPYFGCHATPNSQPGEYDIVPSGAEATNYEISYVNGTLTIERGPVSLIVNNTKAGELSDRIVEEGYNILEVAELKVIGKLNGTDIKNIREMIIDGDLTRLDIEETTIVAGGEAYYSASYYTETGAIGHFMFENCANLASVKLPKTTEEIGGYAFWRCSNLEAIEVPEGVKRIWSQAFADCSKLAFLTIPTTLKYISDKALVGCVSLTTICCYSMNIRDISNDSFSQPNDLKAFDVISDGAIWHIVEGTKSDYLGDESTGKARLAWWNDTWQIIDDLPNINPAPLVTVTVTDAGRLYGDANPVFEYSVEGGTLDGKPELTCVATPTSTVGTYEIVATRGTITNENVNFVNGTLTVMKAPLTIKADDKQMTEGEQLPEFTATYEGFKNGETDEVLTAVPNFVCHATPNSEPGEYEIVPSGAEATNYEINYVNGTLTIEEKKIVIVHVTDASRLYGDANPVFEYSVEGGTLDGKPELTCVATPTSTVGAYEIVATRGNITNENVNFVNGTLTVTKAPLTIKADDKRMTEGDPLPEFTATYEGFKNGETEDVLTAVPYFGCHATPESEPGEYDIAIFGAEATNYEISYVNGTLTIERGPVSLIINNTKAGELSDRIFEEGYSILEVAELKVIGKLNGTDIKNIREMIINGGLTRLDIQEASIVAGGASYDLTRYTENDIIGRYMFQNCKKLVSIKLPATITYIDDSAFYGCSNLEAIEIPEGVTTIDQFAFRDCSSLSFMSIPSTLKKIDNDALKGCSSLTTVYSYILDINEVSPYAYVKGKLKAFDILPDGSVWHVVEGKSDMYTNGESMWWNDTWQIIDDLPNTSGVTSPLYSAKGSDVWHTLQGVRLSAKPSHQGVYVLNGRKVFVR